MEVYDIPDPWRKWLGSVYQKEVPKPEGDDAKATHKKNLVKAKRVIVDSIKDHLIPQVLSLKTPKEVFYALTKMFEWNNINQEITLRNQLKNVKIQNSKTIQSYFTRVAQIKEQLEAIEENVERGLLWPPWMASQDHGIRSFKESVQEGSWSLLADSEKNACKKKLGS